MASRQWPGSPNPYDFLKRANAASLRRNWRIEGDGLERLAGFQGGILAFNHEHLVDGTVVMPLVRERILFLCDARAGDAPVLGYDWRQTMRTLTCPPNSSTYCERAGPIRVS
jgi:hypothetical protein